MTEESEKFFQKSLKPYPSHFDLEIKFSFTKENRRSIIKKLTDEMTTTGFELDAERTRAYNFLSYIHWGLQEHPKAKEYLEKSLSENEDDVMALSNQAWMLWKGDKFSDAWCVVKRLEKLKDRQDLITIAKAEQAFAYCRLGPRYFAKSISKFKEVIQADCKNGLDKTQIYLWKFGLGLILKRQLNMANAFSFDHFSVVAKNISEAVSVLIDVADNANTVRYQARGWVVLGEVAYSIYNLGMLSPEEKGCLPKLITEKKPDEFFDQASSICDDDIYVLQRCGKHARYCKDYSKSIKLLTRSISKRGTSLSHHHLAISLRSVLNKEIAESSHRSCQRRRGSDSQPYCYGNVFRGNPGGYRNIGSKKNAHRQLFFDTRENSAKGNKERIESGKEIMIGNRSVLSDKSQHEDPSKSLDSTRHTIGCSGYIGNAEDISCPEATVHVTTNLAALTVSDKTSPFCNMISKDAEPQSSELNFHNLGRLRSSFKGPKMLAETDFEINRQGHLIGVGTKERHSHNASGREYCWHPSDGLEYRSTQKPIRGWTNETHSSVNRDGFSMRGKKGRGRRFTPILPIQRKYVQGTTSAYQETMSRPISYPSRQYRNTDLVSLGPIESQQHKFLKFMKSPKGVLSYPVGDKRVEQIIYHLDKAVEYSPTNCSAMYDKGLVLRSLRSLEKAANLFKEIKKNKACPKLLAVSCMEQQALCQLELAEMEREPERRETLCNDAKELLFHAIEKAARIATQVPFFHPRGTAFPSLREMLVKHVKRQGSHKPTTLKDFAKLYELAGEYGQALSFYKEIYNMSENEAKDPDIILKMAHNYVKQKDFRDSLLFLDLIETSCTRLVDKNRKLYFEAYLEGALSALKQSNVKAARARFKRTVRFCSKRKMLFEDDDVEGCTYDIHIVTSQASEEKGLRLYNLLKETCGLKVSINSNQTAEELKYNGLYEGVGNIMEQSFLIVIFLDNTSLKQGDLRYFINMAVDLNVDDLYGTGIISVCLGELTVPREIQSFPVFQQPPDLDFSANQHQWLKDFFWKAAEQTFLLDMPNEAESD